ncbi:MAG: hypothetical protein KIT56_07620 [Gammaproteobacteria bacterium]|nr:hypothetical protein [Gammaproteobacteria bacterium]MCW5583728.1 hypothetical protein [Gammaproteobacteria bacterium]
MDGRSENVGKVDLIKRYEDEEGSNKVGLPKTIVNLIQKKAANTEIGIMRVCLLLLDVYKYPEDYLPKDSTTLLEEQLKLKGEVNRELEELGVLKMGERTPEFQSFIQGMKARYPYYFAKQELKNLLRDLGKQEELSDLESDCLSEVTQELRELRELSKLKGKTAASSKDQQEKLTIMKEKISEIYDRAIKKHGLNNKVCRRLDNFINSVWATTISRNARDFVKKYYKAIIKNAKKKKYGFFSILTTSLNNITAISDINSSSYEIGAMRSCLLLLDAYYYPESYLDKKDREDGKTKKSHQEAVKQALEDLGILKEGKLSQAYQLFIREMKAKYPYSFANQQLKNLVLRLEEEGEDVSQLNTLLNTVVKGETEKEKLKTMEELALNTYYEIRKKQSFFGSRVGDELEYFIKSRSGLNLIEKYNIDIPHKVENHDTVTVSKLVENKRPKRVALVDIDGTLVVNGKLNEELIEKLKFEYDSVVLFTQRNRYLKAINLVADLDAAADKSSDSSPVLIGNIVDELKARGISARVSITPLKDSSPSESPYDYYEKKYKLFEDVVIKPRMDTKWSENTQLWLGSLDDDIRREKSKIQQGKVEHYRDLTTWIQARNPGRDIEFSVFEDSIENIAEIAALEPINNTPPSEDDLVFVQEEKKKSANLLPPTFYYIHKENHKGNHKGNQKINCYRLSRNDIEFFSQEKNNGKGHSSSYLELDRVLEEEYIIRRKVERSIDNSRYHSFFGRVSGMSSDIKIRAAEKMICAIRNKSSQVEFTNDEIVALRTGRLGKIITKFEDQLPEEFRKQEGKHRHIAFLSRPRY